MPTNPEELRIEHNIKDSIASPSTVEEVSAPPSPAIPTTFDWFRRLAVELQFMIWSEAIHEWDKRIIIWGKPVVPPLLHACPQSRFVFLKTHEVERWESGGDNPRRDVLFVDWKRNAVHFPAHMPGLNGVPIHKIIEPANAAQQLPSESQTEQKCHHELRYMVVSQNVFNPLIVKIQAKYVGEWLLKEFPKLKKLIVMPTFNRPLGIDDTMDDICFKGFISYRSSRVELGAIAFRNPEYRHVTLFAELNDVINWCDDPPLGESADQEYLGAGEGLY